MLSDAPLYSEHRRLQVHDTKLFLSSTIQKMDWTRQEEDVVMDIGCGTGNSCRMILLPYLPKVKKFIAVDVLPDMIEFAKKNNASDKIEYHLADIENRSTTQIWEGQISKMISIHCLHWVDNQEEAFRNIYHLLKPGGEAALLFFMSTHLWDSYDSHFNNPKWKDYLKDANPKIPKSHYEKLNASYYQGLLGEIGFKTIICDEEKRTYAYPGDEECKAALFSRCGLSNYIPDNLKEDFKEDIFDAFLKYNDRNTDGRPVIYYRTLSLLIQKPKP